MATPGAESAVYDSLLTVAVRCQTELFDTFDETSSPNSDKWDLVQGGRIGVGCASLVEGQSITFEGHGRRQAVTVDLDLRYARSAFHSYFVSLLLYC